MDVLEIETDIESVQLGEVAPLLIYLTHGQSELLGRPIADIPLTSTADHLLLLEGLVLPLIELVLQVHQHSGSVDLDLGDHAVEVLVLVE